MKIHAKHKIFGQKSKTHKGILKGLTKRRQLNKEIKSGRDTFSAIDNVMHL